MTIERWRQLQDAYHAALRLAPSERSDFLKRSAADDDEMVREVEALLEANDAAGEFLGTDAFASEVKKLAVPANAPELERYEILSLIGSGAMGIVYLARDKRLARLVAIKVLLPAFVKDRGRLARFEREARAASTLNHPNIITIYEVGSSGDTHFIAAEFVEGETLRGRMSAGRLDVAQTLRMAVQAAKALDAAHAAGIVHRDVKPENVMVRPDGLVKVLDFGIAKFAEDTIQTISGRTEAGSVIGTPRYMSPEQACGRELDRRSDVFSLAAVVYEMVAGAPAFPGETHAEVFAALLEKAPQPLEKIVPDVPEELAIILKRALSKNADARQQSMLEFAHDLERVLLAVTSGISLAVARTRPRPKFSRRQMLWIAGGASSAAALAVGGPAAFKQLSSGGASGRTLPFGSFAGKKDYPALSPDGSRLAFGWDGGKGGTPSIYLKGLADEPVRLTPLGRDALTPAWSPDGRSIAYVGIERSPSGSSETAVYITPVNGGSDRRVGSSSAGVSWSTDGKRLAVTTTDYSIAAISLETGRETRLTTSKPTSDSFPEFSPDGKSIAFLRGISAPVRDIYIMPAEGGTPRQVTNMKRPITRAVWTSDSRELVFCAWGDMWRISASGGEPRKVAVDALSAQQPSISLQGDRLAFTEKYSDYNLWQYQGPGFGNSDAPGQFQSTDCVLCSTREDHSPSFSPDGERIVFISKRLGYEDLWLANRDGTNVRQLTASGGPANGSPRWSPDGRWITFDSRVPGYPAVFIVSPEGGEPRQLTGFAEAATVPSWSWDSRSVYYSGEIARKKQIFRRPIDGGEPVQVTKGGGLEGMESPDGKLVYFWQDRRTGIFSVPVGGGEEKPVPELVGAGSWRSWGMLKQGIYYVASHDGPTRSIRFFSFRTRRITELATVGKEALWGLPGLAMAPDGRYMLCAQGDMEVNNIKLVDGFR